jgi:hypothetical protein
MTYLPCSQPSSSSWDGQPRCSSRGEWQNGLETGRYERLGARIVYLESNHNPDGI